MQRCFWILAKQVLFQREKRKYAAKIMFGFEPSCPEYRVSMLQYGRKIMEKIKNNGSVSIMHYFNVTPTRLMQPSLLVIHGYQTVSERDTF